MSGEVLQLTSIENNNTEALSQQSSEDQPSMLAKLLHSKKLDAIWITLVVGLSSLWTGWILLNFQTSIDYKQGLLQNKYQLENEIQLLDKKIQYLNAGATNRKKDFANSRVFAGYQEIAEWLYDLAEKSKKTHLNVEYQLHDVIKDERLQNIYIIPIELEVLAVRENNLNGTYNQFLGYMNKFLQQPIYLNLVSASIENVNTKTAKLYMKVHVKMWSNNLAEIKNNQQAEHKYLEFGMDDTQ